MRYYLYISTAKLDILGPQLPWYRRVRQGATKRQWAVAAKPPMADISVSEARELEPSLHKRLRVVERGLYRNAQVGDLADDKPWVHATLTMQWMEIPMLGDGRWSRRRPRAALFWSRDATSIVLLGGSVRHLVDRSSVPSYEDYYRRGASQVSWLLEVRARLLAGSYARGASRRDAFDHFLIKLVGKLPGDLFDTPLVNAPAQRMTFLARRHVADEIISYSHPSTGPTTRRLTLGTPLYVALADPQK